MTSTYRKKLPWKSPVLEDLRLRLINHNNTQIPQKHKHTRAHTHTHMVIY